jgi:FMN phosphatase YigB (HAD superfamily)
MNKNIKKLFFIDFDDTLFNTKKFKDDLINIFLDNGVNEKQFKESYYCVDAETRPKYSPYMQIKNLEDNFGIDGKKLKIEFDNFIKKSQEYLFDDSIKFLEEVSKNNNHLVLLSYGECLFQKMKIDNSGVCNFFDEIIITDDPKIDIILNYKKINIFDEVFFVEDHPEQVDQATKRLNNIKSNISEKIKIIKVSRSDGRYSRVDTKFNFDRFNSLREVLEKVC